MNGNAAPPQHFHTRMRCQRVWWCVRDNGHDVPCSLTGQDQSVLEDMRVWYEGLITRDVQ